MSLCLWVKSGCKEKNENCSLRYAPRNETPGTET